VVENKILIVTGEASGDLHGGRVVEAILRLEPGVRVYAVGSERMRRAGAEILVDSSELSVVGITEVIGRMANLIKAYSKVKKFIQTERPSLLILIDFPDFNLLLAKAAKAANVPTLYYISPQVWAWRSGRVSTIARRVNKMAVIFPFEVPIYKKAGLDVEFVGHPLLDAMADFESRIGPRVPRPASGPLIALLPGSRPGEVQRLLPEMVRAAKILHERDGGRGTRGGGGGAWNAGKKREEQSAEQTNKERIAHSADRIAETPGPGVGRGMRFVLPAAPGIKIQDLERCIPHDSPPIEIVQGKTYEALLSADVAVVASGTATLETAILGKPMVIIYRVSPASYWVGRAMIQVDYIGLVNLVAGRKVVPELIQGEVRGERIAAEVLRILDDGPYREEMLRGLREVREKLGAPGAAERVAGMALEIAVSK